MADYSDPKRATAYRFTLSLYARADNQIKTAPTLAAGDVKVSKDNGATANITTLPAETPASSGILKVDLSATEMTADLVTVIFRDAAGAEWNDVVVHIAPSTVQMADLATAAALTVVDDFLDTEVAAIKAKTDSLTFTVAGVVDANTLRVGGTLQTAGDLAAMVTAVDDFLDTEVAAILADTNELQTDWANGGRLDLLIDAIKAKTDALPTDPADQSALEALIAALPTATENAAELLDIAAGVETGLTVRQAMRLMAAVLFGKASGMSSTTAVFRDFGDTKDRITAVVDGDGNRTAISRDAT
jgi:hypothetical protein